MRILDIDIRVPCAHHGDMDEAACALWVLDADTAEEVEAIFKGDPLVEAEVITSWRIRSTAYWSAQDAKGAQ